MEKFTRIFVDTSKHIFQLHGVDAAEQPVLRRKLGRRVPGSRLRRAPE
jgi:transposase